ncbi:spermidine synthase [Paenibacillus taihuensis]|uniref:Spermidine synthase n=1 Tax=Paenibacillus taihuensis TaxID=1156355 RepID=A0A3D9RKB5_9BACL|nr:fused MFS/spermidine synthase [Paenibacillus taihuensis]REE80187.1 spermidine synthase [Paenibacillus taihuensis]
MQILFSEVTGQHEITVYDTSELSGERGRFRVLQFAENAMQGAMDLDNPERILFEYPRAMIHLMTSNNPSYVNVFLIGHGIGTIARSCPGVRFTTAELDGQVVQLSKELFGCRDDNVRIGDGRAILEEQPDHAFDYILLDAFTAKGTPKHLTSRAFFELTAAKLAEGGAVILNVMGKGGQDTVTTAVHSTLQAIFAYTRVFALPSANMPELRNIIMVGSEQPIRFQESRMAGFSPIELERGYIIEDR